MIISGQNLSISPTVLLEISFFALAKVGIFDDFLATDGVLMGNFAEVIAKIARMAMFEMLKVCM